MQQSRVDWRVVYSRDSFTRPDAWDETVRMMSEGEQARICVDLPIKLVVVDRKIALIGLRLDGQSLETMVTESPPLVNLLVETFESYWARALPLSVESGPAGERPRRLADGLADESFSSGFRPRPAAPPTREEQAILAFIGAGLTDEVIAARLGLSVRTLRRRSQKLMSDLRAENRFQLGVEAAKRGWV